MKRGKVILLCSRKIFLVLFLILVGVLVLGGVLGQDGTCSSGGGLKGCSCSNSFQLGLVWGQVNAQGACSPVQANNCNQCNSCIPDLGSMQNAGNAIDAQAQTVMNNIVNSGKSSYSNTPGCDPDKIQNYLNYVNNYFQSANSKPDSESSNLINLITNCFGNNGEKVANGKMEFLFLQAELNLAYSYEAAGVNYQFNYGSYVNRDYSSDSPPTSSMMDQENLRDGYFQNALNIFSFLEGYTLRYPNEVSLSKSQIILKEAMCHKLWGFTLGKLFPLQKQIKQEFDDSGKGIQSTSGGLPVHKSNEINYWRSEAYKLIGNYELRIAQFKFYLQDLKRAADSAPDNQKSMYNNEIASARAEFLSMMQAKLSDASNDAFNAIAARYPDTFNWEQPVTSAVQTCPFARNTLNPGLYGSPDKISAQKTTESSNNNRQNFINEMELLKKLIKNGVNLPDFVFNSFLANQAKMVASALRNQFSGNCYQYDSSLSFTPDEISQLTDANIDKCTQNVQAPYINIYNERLNLNFKVSIAPGCESVAKLMQITNALSGHLWKDSDIRALAEMGDFSTINDYEPYLYNGEVSASDLIVPKQRGIVKNSNPIIPVDQFKFLGRKIDWKEREDADYNIIGDFYYYDSINGGTLIDPDHDPYQIETSAQSLYMEQMLNKNLISSLNELASAAFIAASLPTLFSGNPVAIIRLATLMGAWGTGTDLINKVTGDPLAGDLFSLLFIGCHATHRIFVGTPRAGGTILPFLEFLSSDDAMTKIHDLEIKGFSVDTEIKTVDGVSRTVHIVTRGNFKWMMVEVNPEDLSGLDSSKFTTDDASDYQETTNGVDELNKCKCQETQSVGPVDVNGLPTEDITGLKPVELSPKDVERINNFKFNSIELKRIADLETRLRVTLSNIQRRDFILAHDTGNNLDKIAMLRAKLSILQNSFDSPEGKKQIKIIINEGFAGKKIIKTSKLIACGWTPKQIAFRRKLISMLDNLPNDFNEIKITHVLDRYKQICKTSKTAPKTKARIWEGTRYDGVNEEFSVDIYESDAFDLVIPGRRTYRVPSHIDIQLPDCTHQKLFIPWKEMIERNSDVLDFFGTSPEEVLKNYPYLNVP